MALQLAGSSPRVRGKRVGDDVVGFGAGLIPACAGKTRKQLAPVRLERAHPRVCGENTPRARTRVRT